MVHFKRYILMAVLAVGIFVWRFDFFGVGFETVLKSGQSRILKEEWNPMIAASVNEKKLVVNIDSREYTNRKTSVFMDENLNIMVPVDILTEALNCSSHLYQKKELLIEKRNDTVLLKLNNPEILINGTARKIISPMIKKDGRYYVSLREVAAGIGYSFAWDMEKNQALAGDISEMASVFPASYDLRFKKRVGTIKDQADTGTCWAFASLSALESTLLPEESMQFSPDHMTFGNSFVVDISEGGEYMMALAYLLAWQGPVNERDDPFGDGKTEPGLSPVKHVQEVQMMEGKDYEKIKEAVFCYGGVQTALYSSMGSGTSGSEFYNPQKSAYCYIGTERPNHEVVIIGWDDNYPKENFSVNVEGNGAFICQNSWGSEFGEDGVFYVSYYDTNIGSHNIVYTKAEETDNYDHIYQSDLCGWVGQIGFNRESVYGANVYTARRQEELAAVGFYATGKNTKYRIYLVKNFEDMDSFQNRKLITEGCVKNIGYYTVDVPSEKELLLESGERYAVMLYLDTPEAIHPMAIEYASGEGTKDVILKDGEGYISVTGENWQCVEETFSCNLCIKVYTNDHSKS
ncbi:MAG: cell surface protein [Eubacterium sp.]|nr:cell surface protein [Eubacterium sp.]